MAAAALLAMLLPAAAGAYADGAGQKLASGGRPPRLERKHLADYKLSCESRQLVRYISIDPVGGNNELPQGWNRYSYALDNPVEMVPSH